MVRKGYLANQLGFSETGRYLLENLIIPKLSALGIDVLEPFNECSKRIILPKIKDDSYSELLKAWKNFNTQVPLFNNALMMEADIMLPILDGGHTVDDGTSSEIGYYAGIKPQNPIFALRTDFRFADNLAAPINIQIMGYITMSGGMYTSVDAWLKAIEAWLKRNPC